MSVGITLQQIWVIVWFAAGIVAIVAGIMWGAKSDVSFALEIRRAEGPAGSDPRWLHVDPGRHYRRPHHRHFREAVRILLGQSDVGGSTESWFPFFLALLFLLFRPQGLFGEKIIERI
jgi:branched-chain amino acid transport system permease protein